MMASHSDLSDIQRIIRKRVLLRVNLDRARQFPFMVEQILPSIAVLLENGCSVCVLAPLGPVLLDPAKSCHGLLPLLMERFDTQVTWLPSLFNVSMKLGRLYVLENPFKDSRDILCDPSYVGELHENVDVVVHDTLHHLDANYASSRGLLLSQSPQTLGLGLQNLEGFNAAMRSSRVGLILGGESVSWQLRLARSLVHQLSFVAVGSEVASVMMGAEPPLLKSLYDDVFQTLALFKKEKVKVLYPVDVVAYSVESQRNRICLFQDLDAGEKFYDLGSKSRMRILEHVEDSDVEMVVVSGGMGRHLDPRFSVCSELLLQALSQSVLKTAIIGRDSIVTANRLSLLDKFSIMTLTMLA